VFKNQGQRAGASIAHLHSQLVALPFIPPVIADEERRAGEKFSETRLCPYCDFIERERAAGERIVLEQDGFIAFCPFASWQPYEVWLMPACHVPAFETSSADEFKRLAAVLCSLIGRLESIGGGADYNLLVRTAPWIDAGDNWSHWRIELMPRINAFAGLEVGTGIHINPLSPERAARQLRADLPGIASTCR
jgi:UDPglucose--hexose-1-phosphate uridylyltransferase